MIVKKALFKLILFIVLTASIECANSQSKEAPAEIFKISRDTIQVGIEGRLSNALLVDDKYYAFYEIRDPLSSLPIKKFYIIAKRGKSVKEVKVPEELHEDVYSFLRYWQGHIIAISNVYENKSSYFLDEGEGKFVKQPALVKVPVYEDSNYQVTGECRGEFGSTTYFTSKSTGRTYSVFSGCPFVINKLGDKYLINTSEIVKIEDTTKNKNNLTDTVRRSADQYFFNNNSTFDFKFYFPTSFVANGVLYQIYNSYKNRLNPLAGKEQLAVTKDTVKIGTIVGGKFKPVYVLKDHIEISLQQQLSPDYQICTFHTEERMTIGFKKDIPPYREATYGLIEIKGNEIKIHYFFGKKDR